MSNDLHDLRVDARVRRLRQALLNAFAGLDAVGRSATSPRLAQARQRRMRHHGRMLAEALTEFLEDAAPGEQGVTT